MWSSDVRRWVLLVIGSFMCNMCVFFVISTMLPIDLRVGQLPLARSYRADPDVAVYAKDLQAREDEGISIVNQGLSWIGCGIAYLSSYGQGDNNEYYQNEKNGATPHTYNSEEQEMRKQVEELERRLGWRLEDLRSAMNRATTMECKRKIFATTMRYRNHTDSASTMKDAIEFPEEIWKKDIEYWEHRIQLEKLRYPAFTPKDDPMAKLLSPSFPFITGPLRRQADADISSPPPNSAGGGRPVPTMTNHTMRIGFIMLVHSVTLQAELLMEALYHPDHFYVMHVDRAATPVFTKNMEALVERYYLMGRNVWLVPEEKRKSVTWAGYSMVAAQLAGVDTLFENAGDLWDYCINLSGADFPLKTVQYMSNYLQREYPYNFMEIFPPHVPGHEAYAFAECDRHVFRVADRPLPQGFPQRRGSQWFALTRVFFEWLRTTQPLYSRLNQFYEDSLFSDEGYLPSVFPLSPFKDLVRHRLHCLVWGLDDLAKSKCRHLDEADWCGRGPVSLDLQQATAFLANPFCFFARKFDIDSRWDVLRVIDVKLKQMQWEAGYVRIVPP